MDEKYLKELLNNVKNGSISVDDALMDLKNFHLKI